MFERMNQKCNSRWTFILVLVILTLWCAPLLAGQAGGGDSPETVFKMGQELGAKKDFSGLAKLVAPSERSLLAFGTDMGVGMFLEFYEGEKAADLKKKYEEIQKRYGVENENEDDGEKLHVTKDTPQEVIDAHIRKRAQKLYGHVDVVKYVPDLMALVVSLPEMADQAFFPQEELSGLKIDGDRATGNAGEKSISFIREGDKWWFTADVIN
jgi:hypothetical protein